MFANITNDRLLAMNDEEIRWLDNIKKAFYQSDSAYSEGRAHDHCLPELCKAIDTAKTLQRSLRGDDTSTRDNKKRYIEFLNFELPSLESGGFQAELFDDRSKKSVKYSFAELVYDIRCMVLHENENLNVAESPNYHILLDWSNQHTAIFGSMTDGKLTCNGHMIWERVRQILAKFITGLDAMITIANLVKNNQGGSFSISISPPLGTVRPKGIG